MLLSTSVIINEVAHMLLVGVQVKQSNIITLSVINPVISDIMNTISAVIAISVFEADL